MKDVYSAIYSSNDSPATKAKVMNAMTDTPAKFKASGMNEQKNVNQMFDTLGWDGKMIDKWFAMTIHINFTSPLEIESGEEYKIVTTLDFRSAGHSVHALVEIVKVSTGTVVISEPASVS